MYRVSANAQQTERATDGPTSAADFEDQIIVRGRAWGELRFEIERAEQAVFDRFNELNSDDRFDIVCRSEVPIGSNIPRRVCQANFGREQASNMGQTFLQALQGQAAVPWQAYWGEQARMQQRLVDEMRRLVDQDEELAAALQHLGRTQLLLAESTGSRRPWSTSRQVVAREGSLPYGAALMFEVEMGRRPWEHRLTQQTFEIAHVTGDIKRLEVECAQGRERHKYDGELAWTLPPGRTDCTLRVHAKRDATFVLYEFERGM